MTTNKDALVALDKCWKPSNGTLRLDANAAWNFVGTHEETIRAALETQAELVEALKATREVLLSDDIPWQPIAICRIDKALARAEGKE